MTDAVCGVDSPKVLRRARNDYATHPTNHRRHLITLAGGRSQLARPSRALDVPMKLHSVVVDTRGILSLMAKYDPLFEYLCKAGDGSVTLTFDEIERVVGSLPASATRYPTWWANEAGTGSHVQARAWLNSGREVESVDMAARRVRFSAARWRRGS